MDQGATASRATRGRTAVPAAKATELATGAEGETASKVAAVWEETAVKGGLPESRQEAEATEATEAKGALLRPVPTGTVDAAETALEVTAVATPHCPTPRVSPEATVARAAMEVPQVGPAQLTAQEATVAPAAAEAMATTPMEVPAAAAEAAARTAMATRVAQAP